MCTAKPCQHTLHYRLTADDQVLDAVTAFDPNRTIAIRWFEVGLPQIGGFQDV